MKPLAPKRVIARSDDDWDYLMCGHRKRRGDLRSQKARRCLECRDGLYERPESGEIKDPSKPWTPPKQIPRDPAWLDTIDPALAERVDELLRELLPPAMVRVAEAAVEEVGKEIAPYFRPRKLREIQQNAVRAAVARCGSKAGAAKELGIHVRTLYNILRYDRVSPFSQKR